MNIKITFDPDGVYGYPKGEIIDGQQLVEDYIDCLNEVEDADTIKFLKEQLIEKAVDFVAEMWSLNYDIIPDDKVIRKCSVCGKQITEGYVFDGTDCFCSKECATHFFAEDEGCVEILIDEADRLEWHDELPQREHFRVNIGHFSPDCFHHFDNEQTMFRWISEKVGEEIHSFDDCEAWTRQQDDEHGSYIEILCVGDLKDFYTFRRAYLLKVRECQDYMEKAQRLPRSPRRDFYLEKYNHAYDDANWYWMAYPEVWQGEI